MIELLLKVEMLCLKMCRQVCVMCIQWISRTCVDEVLFWNEFHKVCHGFTGFVKQYWMGRNRISIYPRLSFPHSCVLYCVDFSIHYLIRPDFTVSEISVSNLPILFHVTYYICPFFVPIQSFLISSIHQMFDQIQFHFPPSDYFI